MPAPINTLPSGLLSFFGIQQLGRFPGELGQAMVPVMDLREFYIAPQLTSLTTSANLGAATGFLGVIATIPPGEVWMISSYHLQVEGLAAGDSVAIATALGHPNTTGTFNPELLGEPGQGVGTAGAEIPVMLMAFENRGRLFPSGTQLGAFVVNTVIAAPPAVLRAFVRFARLRA